MNRFTLFPRRTPGGLAAITRIALLAFTAPLTLALAAPVFAQTAATTTTTMTLTSGGSAVTSVSSGTVITLTATVLAGATPVTTGLVNFCDATATYCEDVHIVGSAQLTSAGTAVFKFRPGSGSRSYKAVFVGTNTNAGSASAATALTVTGPSPTTISIASSGSPGNFTLAATVGGAHSTAPTGTLSFLDTSNNNAVVATASLGAGTGAFQFVSSSTLSAGAAISENDLAVADFNGDGIADFAVTGGSAASPIVTVYLGAANGTFTPVTTSLTVNPLYPASIPTNALVADFNGDGIPDLLVGCSNNGAGVPPGCLGILLLGKGDGTFSAGASLSEDGVSSSIAVGDFNGDGIPDIAVALSDFLTPSLSGVMVYFGNGDGTFTNGTSITISGLKPWAIAVGDFNGDGIMDMAVTDPDANEIHIVLGNSAGNPTLLPAISVSGMYGYAYGLVVADFNQDGLPDLAVASGSINPYVLLGNGDGTFSAVSADTKLVEAYGFAVGDFNGDGIANLVTANETASGNFIQTLSSLENGTFGVPAAELPYAFTGSVTRFPVVAGDLNGDGVTDVAVVNGLPSASVLLRENTATATTGVSLAAGTHLIEASYAGDDANSASISGTVQIVVPGTATTLTLTSSTSSPTYGGAVTLTATLSPYVSGATSSNGETVTFYNGSTSLGTGTLVSGVAKFTTNFLPAGTDSITAAYAGDSALVNSTSAPLSIVVSQPTLTVTANNASRPLGAANPPLTGTVTGAVNGDTFTVTATTTATQSSPVGTYPIVPVASGPDLSNYIVNIVDGVLTVTLPVPTISAVSASVNPAMAGSPVTFAVNVTSQNGTPTGTVTFLDGSTPLGTGTLTSGSATYTTSSLAAGTHAITANYSGDTNFGAVTSAVLSEVIESFSVGGSSGGSTTQTASPGGTATYALSVTPPTVGDPITFSVTGLPTGATATFTPSTIPVGAGPTSVSLVVTLPATAAAQPATGPLGNGAIPISLGLILLPFAGRMRKGSRRWLWIVILAAAGLAATSACGGGGSSGGGGGGGGSNTPQNYTLTVTATSGTLTQTTTLTLTVN